MYKNKLKIFIVFILVLSFGIVNLNGAYAEDRWGGVSTQQSTVPSVTSDGMSQSYASQNVEVRKDLEKVNKSKKGWDITKAVMGATAALGAGVAIAGFFVQDPKTKEVMIATGLPIAAGAGVTAFIADGQSKELRRKSLNLEGRIEDNWDAMTRNAQVGQDIVLANNMKQSGLSNSSTNAMHAGAVEDIYFGPVGGGNVPNQNGNNPPPTSKTTTKSKSGAVSDSVTVNFNDLNSGYKPETDPNSQCCFIYYGGDGKPAASYKSLLYFPKPKHNGNDIYYYMANCAAHSVYPYSERPLPVNSWKECEKRALNKAN